MAQQAICRGRSDIASIVIEMSAAPREIGFSGSTPRTKMQDFKSAKSARRFVSVHAAVYNTLKIQRQLIPVRASTVFEPRRVLERGDNCSSIRLP
jgi:hypothetical protein